MGSLLSVPKAPKIVTTSPVVSESASAPLPADTTASTINQDTTTEEAQEKEKTDQNLLERSKRGRASTVLTSFRGLLESNSNTPARKSLLGE